MKKRESVFVFVLLLLLQGNIFAGFGAGTPISSHGILIPIEQLQVGDLVDCHDTGSHGQMLKLDQRSTNPETSDQRYTQKAVTGKQSHTASEYLVLAIGEQRLVLSPDQKLYLPERQTWLQARDCAAGDLLLGRNGLVSIDDIFTVCEPVAFFDITVQDCHNFLVLADGILVHNILPVFVGITAAFGGGVVADWCLTAGIAGIAAIGIKLAKEKYSARHDTRFIVGPDAGSIYYHDKKHPHGKFEGVDYHSQKGSGRKSPGPKNGQEALDRSVQIKNTSPNRIGVSCGQIVMLNKTAEGVYHGYVVTWEHMLKEAFLSHARNALIRNGLVDKFGRIL